MFERIAEIGEWRLGRRAVSDHSHSSQHSIGEDKSAARKMEGSPINHNHIRQSAEMVVLGMTQWRNHWERTSQ